MFHAITEAYSNYNGLKDHAFVQAHVKKKSGFFSSKILLNRFCRYQNHYISRPHIICPRAIARNCVLAIYQRFASHICSVLEQWAHLTMRVAPNHSTVCRANFQAHLMSHSFLVPLNHMARINASSHHTCFVFN